MQVAILPHARERAELRGATAEDIAETVLRGERAPAKPGRTTFTLDHPGRWLWRERVYATKRLEVVAVFENEAWLAITVIVTFF
jgi:hypothetical protein